MKKGIAFLLALLMILSVLPVGALAAQAEELPQLASPTDLQWGYDRHRYTWDSTTNSASYITVEQPGYISWKIESPSQNQYEILVYKVGETEPVLETGMGYSSNMTVEFGGSACFCTADLDSGSYYFTITAQGDGVNYRDSETAVSPVWNYVKPEAQIAPCTNLTWVWPQGRYDAPADRSNVGGYEISFFHRANTSSEMYWIGSQTMYDQYAIYGGIYLQVPNFQIQNFGDGQYFFQARALSADITKSRNSEWSEISPAYDMGEVTVDVETMVDRLVMDTFGSDPGSIREAVRNLDNAMLHDAILADSDESGILADIKLLEERAGGAAVVVVTDAASAFEAEKISVVGASLNIPVDGGLDIKLIVDKPDQPHEIPEAYNNSVAVRFSMDLENVANTENLEVPVKITLPVPANINPDFLVILHYHTDGTREDYTALHTFEKDGQQYVSFVVTGFSDFILTQKAPDPETCTHSFGQWETTKDATCTEDGTKERTCSLCSEKETDTIPAKGHTEVTDKAVAATCTKPGKTEGKHCSVCKEVIVAQTTVDALEHEYVDGVCTLCGHSTNTYVPVTDNVNRIFGSGRCETARKVADAMKDELGVEKFDAILYTSAMNFADALAGSYLSAVKNAPILLYLENSTDPQANLEYIQNNLADGGTVYILGGNSAVPESVDNTLAELGINAQRVAGTQRFQTNIEILKASGFSGNSTVLVCTAMNFADSLSASATGLPILLVYDKWTELSDEYKDYLKDFSGLNFVVVGGKNAVSEALEQSLKDTYGEDAVTRLAGATRYETSTMVAETFFQNPESAVLAYAMNFPDGLCGGALAYAKGSPLILTNTGATAKAESYVQGKGIETGTVLGGEGLISDEAAEEVFGTSTGIEGDASVGGGGATDW